MIMESSRNFSYDTCLSEFTRGWVRDHQSPSGIKNYQREDTNQNPRSWLTPLQSSLYGSLILDICKSPSIYNSLSICNFPTFNINRKSFLPLVDPGLGVTKDLLSPPRSSPRLYLRYAREHYKLNKMLEMDEWKEWCIFKLDNHFYYA